MPITAATAGKNAKRWGIAGLLLAARGSSSMVISLGKGLVQGCREKKFLNWEPKVALQCCKNLILLLKY